MRNKWSPLLLLLMVGLFMTVLRNRTPPTIAPPEFDEAYDCSLTDCGSLTSATGTDHLVLQEAEACENVGYLCSGLEEQPSFRVLRWSNDTQRIRIRIPLPPNENSPTTARALQGAAVRGVMSWNEKPFVIVTDTRRRTQEPADIVLQWSSTLGGNKLGVTRVQPTRVGGEWTLSVLQLALATRSPRDWQIELDPKQVMLTAAHEMGHALGLPHSDESRDVMFPTNSARALTNRDYRTLVALYATPNGAEIRGDQQR
jgi:predicted Zn-dependent protease